jgi:hypothetical protein
MEETLFKLQFENNPWQCKIIREGKTVFHLKTDLETRHSELKKDAYEFTFDNASLLMRVRGPKVSLKWQGKGICNRIQMLGYWYGGGETLNQHLLWNQVMLPLTEFFTCDNGRTGLSTLLSPIWISSLGVGLSVSTPFSVAINQPPDKYLLRQHGLVPNLIPIDQRPVMDKKREGDQQITLVGDGLEFDVHLENDIVGCFRALVREIGVPGKTPPLELLGAPIWTTWARYKDRIDQDTVLKFAREIQDNGYPHHVLEIDDRWQTHYGDLEFDPERFPDPKKMIRELKERGFKVTVWVIPFFHPQSRAGQEAARAGYLVQTSSGDPYRVMWWQGAGYLLDVTHPQALKWFKNRLDEFQNEFGLDGFKFDAGEGCFAPPDGVYHHKLESRNQYSHLYVKWIAENFSFCEARTGWRNQTSPIFFRLWDLWSVWGYDNGLRSIIPATLAMSLTGYPFVFPDMIGGNAYFTVPKNCLVSWVIYGIVIPSLERKRKKNSAHPEEETLGQADVPAILKKSTWFGYPTPELLVRWAQANVFLQVMQFSLAPWDFGEKCNRLCRKYAQLHLEFVPVLEKFARLAAETGEPIIRPVFWLAPRDERALTCDDQFLVGDEILVAPVLKAGGTSREIYFPPGKWRDYWSGEIYSGPVIIKGYPAPLEKLPFFIRQEG